MFNKIRPYEFSDRVHCQVTFELDRHLYQIDRTVYNILDLIGNVGGLVSGLTLMFTFLIGVMNFNKFEHMCELQADNP